MITVSTERKLSCAFDVSSRNRRKPTATSPITPITRATIGSGKWRLNAVTATVHTLSISTHNSSEPSCPPHTAANW